MRLINSDSQVVDARVTARESGNANSNSLRVDASVIILGAAIFVMLLSVAAGVWAMSDSKATRNLLETERENWRSEFAALRSEQHDTKTQAWLAERRLIDMESYAMLNGWKVPGDTQHGPTGNLERMTGKEKAHGRK